MVTWKGSGPLGPWVPRVWGAEGAPHRAGTARAEYNPMETRIYLTREGKLGSTATTRKVKEFVSGPIGTWDNGGAWDQGPGMMQRPGQGQGPGTKDQSPGPMRAGAYADGGHLQLSKKFSCGCAHS